VVDNIGHGCIPIATGVLSTLSPKADRMAAALVPEMLATDLADYLVRKGVPFRQTHHIAGEAVRVAEERGEPLDALTLEDLQALHPSFEADVAQVGARPHSCLIVLLLDLMCRLSCRAIMMYLLTA
jgi:argininosuccinate lyase